MKERRTKNSQLSIRGYKAPKWFVQIFTIQTFEKPSRGYSGINAVKRIIQDIRNNE